MHASAGQFLFPSLTSYQEEAGDRCNVTCTCKKLNSSATPGLGHTELHLHKSTLAPDLEEIWKEPKQQTPSPPKDRGTIRTTCFY